MTETTVSSVDVKRYDLKEVAVIAHVCYETVWRAVSRGDLKATRRKPHGRWLVTEDDMARWAFPEAEER